MGHIGYKLLSGFIQCSDPFKHTVKGIRDQLSFCIIRYGNVRIHIAVRNILDGPGDLIKRLNQDARQNISQDQYHNSNDTDHKNLLLLQHSHAGIDLIHGNTYHHHALHIVAAFFIHDGHRHLNIFFRGILSGLAGLIAQKYLLRDHGFSHIQIESILYDPKIAVNDQHTSTVNIGQKLQLTV